MKNSTIQTLNDCVNKLMGKLVAAKERLRLCESSSGTGRNIRTMNRLRDEIDSLERRLQRAERLQDAELAKPLFG